MVRLRKASLAGRWCGWMLLALSAVAMSAPAQAQGPTTGALRGVVREAGGAPLGDALVTVTERETGVRRSGFTVGGRFDFDQLPPGEYALLAERVGFPPLRLERISVRPSRATTVVVRLDAAPLATEESSLAEQGGLPGTSQWLPGFALRSLPGGRGELDEWLRLSTWMDERLGVEGLPSWMTQAAVDGVPYRAVRHPLVGASGLTFLPIAGVGAAEAVSNAFDVEWASAAGATISAHTRRGTPATSLSAAAGWSGSAVSSPGAFEAGSLTWQNLDGSLVARGPALADSARFAVGVSARKWEVPFSPAWPASDAAAQLAAFAASRSLELGAYRQATLVPLDAVSAFGALEWSVARGHRLELAVNAGVAPAQRAVLDAGGALERSSRDVIARATLRSVLSSRRRNTLHVSATSSLRESLGAGGARLTELVSDDLAFGSAGVSTIEESMVRVSDALEFRGESHNLKLGAELSVSNFDYAYRPGAGGRYRFGGVTQLQNGIGVYTRTAGPATPATWSTPRYALFAQDRWSNGLGLEVTLGAKLEREKLEPGVRADAEWYRLTGLANDSVSTGGWQVSPRGAVTWDVQREQRWLLHVAGGLYNDRVDPLLIAEWKLDDGSAETLHAVGDLGAAWPSSEPTPTARGRRLTLLGPEFRSPRTARVGGGVTHQLSGATRLQLDGVFRDTRFLPRRADLNLLQSPSGRDGAGRGIFGTLVQQGGLLVAEPGSNRRFPDYDQVAALNVDGWSRFWGATVSAQHVTESGLSVIARYTFSRTTDNWFGAGAAGAAGGWGTAAPPSLGENGDWTKGTSDFDLPHRAAIGAALEAPFGIRVSALYRWQSGRPFTAAYRAGVDANGDGTAGNDPAFVDPSVAGTSALFGAWPCLQQRSGRIAERNGCRSEATQTLDLQASARLLRVGRGELALRVDVIDLLETDFRTTDAALYLVDPTGTVQRNETTRTLTLPLLVNPAFGEPLNRARAGRLLRIGAALTW